MDEILDKELTVKQKIAFRKAKKRVTFQVIIIYVISLVLMKLEYGEYGHFTKYGLFIDPLFPVLVVLLGMLPFTVITNALLYMFKK